MVKKICLISFVSIFALAVFFHHSFQTAFFKWALHTYSSHYFDSALSYQKAYLKEGRFIIEAPRLQADSGFSAKQIAIDYHFNFWKRQLTIGLILDQPEWQLNEALKVKWKKWQALLSAQEAFFQIHPHLQIKKGCLNWASSHASDPNYEVWFDADINSLVGGYIRAYLEKDAIEENGILIQAFSKPEAIEMGIECTKVNCMPLVALIKIALPDLESYQISSGYLDGKIKVVFPSKQRPYAEGEMIIEHLAFAQNQLHLEGSVAKARLTAEKNIHFNPDLEFSSTTIGKLDFLHSVNVFCDNPDGNSWKLSHLEGYARLDGLKEATFAFQAQGLHQNHQLTFKLQGEAHLNVQRRLNLDMNMICSSSDSNGEGNIHLLFHPTVKDEKIIEMEVEKMTYVDCRFIQALFETYWPQKNKIELQRGKLDALIIAHLDQQGIASLQFKHFKSSDLQFKLPALEAICSCSDLKGHGTINLKDSDSWHSLDADLEVDNGYIQLDQFNPNLPLKAIQTHLTIKQGMIPHALVTMNLAKMKGVMDIEWGKEKEVITLKLEGQVQDLAELFPNDLKEGLHSHFQDHHLAVLANIRQRLHQLELLGTVHIQDNQSKKDDLIHFGCDLKYMAHNQKKKIAPNGWFYAKNLPLEKYISPFIFKKNILNMSGAGEFKGLLDNQTLIVKYDVENLKIENEDLLIEAPQLHSSVPGQLLGLHQFDLKTFTHHGRLPVQKASYFEKNSGLYFKDIQGALLFKDKTIHIRSMEAYCHDVYFAGCLDLDYSNPAPGVFTVAIKSPHCFGKISQIQSILSHFQASSPLYKIPLEGDLNGRNKGLSVNFSFIPHDYHLQAAFQGTIVDGFLPAESADMSLKGLYMDVDYHHDRECLELTDIQGSLLVGKPSRVKEYVFGGDHICLQGIERQNLNLNIWVKDKQEELMRFVAYTKDREEGLKELIIDLKASHISHLYPQSFVCHLRNWSTLETVKGQFKIEIEGLIKDLKRFRQTGLLGLSSQLLTKLNHFDDLKGVVDFNLDYNPLEGSYDYLLKSSQIQTQSLSLHTLLLEGKKQEKRWIIDHFQWDRLIVSANFQEMGDKWKIHFLGLNDGESLLMGLEGDFFPQEGCIRAKVKLGEVNLAKIGQWEICKEWEAKWQPKGLLFVTGDMKLIGLQEAPWFCLETDLIAEVRQPSVKDYSFYVKRPFQLKFKADKTIQIQNIALELLPNSDDSTSIYLKELVYQPNDDQWGCSDLTFNFASQHLERLANTWNQHFPNLVGDSFKQFFASFKKQGELVGKLKFAISPPDQTLTLTLMDGAYQVKNRLWNLKDFKLTVKDKLIAFSANSFQESCPFHIEGTANWPNLEEGEYLLKDQLNLTNDAFDAPLIVHWKDDPDKGFLIQDVNGQFCGATFHLNSQNTLDSPKNWSMLEGKIKIDFNQLCPLLAPSLAETIRELKIGSFYDLSGCFWADFNSIAPFWDSVFFQGQLESQEAILKGYQVSQLTSDINYSPKRLELQNMAIQDAAGDMISAEMIAVEDEQSKDWWLFIPQLSIKNLKPSLLKKLDEEHSSSAKFKTLVIKRLDLKDFSGNLNQLSSWRGQGSLHFQNPSRKNIYHPLLAIPAEIILRLGLTPQVLNPVTGTIIFHLQGERFYLMKFKDVYSEGRGSKFYLADSPTPSWMDIKGNLFVQIRMKQYNLIFKLAELFTVSVQGHIKKPKYTLQKQVKMPRKGLQLL